MTGCKAMAHPGCSSENTSSLTAAYFAFKKFLIKPMQDFRTSRQLVNRSTDAPRIAAGASLGLKPWGESRHTHLDALLERLPHPAGDRSVPATSASTYAPPRPLISAAWVSFPKGRNG